MTMYALMLLASLNLTATDQVIDAFDYADGNAAQQAWADSADRGHSSAGSMETDGKRSVLQLHAPFADQSELSRVYIDRRVNLNLAAAGEFILDISTSSPEAAGRVSLYFHSGNGWYAAGRVLSEKGWNTLRFSKASFVLENRPAGWHRVDAIRIAVWR